MTEPTVRVERIPEAPDLPFRLGRHLVHDERSRSFAFTAPEPRPIVDVAWRRRVPAYNQGQLGSCTANALCGALSTRPQRHRFRSQRNIVGVYSEATTLDPWPGQYEPDDTGSSGLAVAKAALRRGWISEYRHIFRWDDFLQAMMVGPVIVGTAWWSEMFDPEPDGRVHPMLGRVVGGHEYQAYGVDVANRRVWFFNSWSEQWGVKGRFWQSWDDFRDLLADDGDATVLVP
jgi:hypothetical protein